MRARGRSRGMTMVETAVSAAIIATIALGVAGVMGASGALARRAHAGQIASQENRRSLERIANAMRNAAVDQISGFDAAGSSTAPQFRAVTGCEAGVQVLGPSQTIQWYSQKDACNAANAGRVDVVIGGAHTCLADRVQSGGFRVTLNGNTLKVFLTTYAPGTDGGLVHASGEASVTIRN